ncbi:MAG: RecX family transcriptional regulator [Acidobacteriota bacterium]|nr:RecX family transcriptional regulator [Acidobacteriota bacterium]MDQ7087124.1 RecX family transcriptional regulator [Acidobacteriota bacterium]
MGGTAWDKALDLLSRRSYTRGEIRRRLVRAGWDEGEVGEVLLKLERLALVDDRQVAYNHARRRALESRRGRRRIRAELIRRDLEPDLVEEVLDEVLPPEQEEQALRRAAARLAPGGRIPRQRSERDRLARRLLRAGFAPGSVRSLLEGSGQDDLDGAWGPGDEDED